jgi:glyoxylase-like metal-dependent hydrolase (beta-lactamase superfamily II)
MSQEVKTINLGGVNCYLVKTDDGYILIDNGFSTKRADLEKEMESAGCQPGNLKLVIITHGDSDHAGNCAYLRQKYAVKIAIHKDDLGMVEYGDMDWNRKPEPDKFSLSFRIMTFFVRRFSKPLPFDTFTPDMTVEDGYDLSTYGFDAHVLHLPGHSKGSIGILTEGGDLFCGDLFYNFLRPATPFIDDMIDFRASLEKLRSLSIKTVYPGHGKPFPMAAVWRSSWAR